MRDQRVVSITTATGDRLAVIQERHPRRSYGRMFHTVFDDAALRIAQTITAGSTLRLLMILPKHLSYTIFRKLNQKVVGQEIDLDHSQISRALKQLQEIGAVEKKGSGAHIEWKLSSDFGWKGDVNSWHIDQRRKTTRSAKAPAKTPHLQVAEGIKGLDANTNETKQRQRRLRLLQPIG